MAICTWYATVSKGTVIWHALTLKMLDGEAILRTLLNQVSDLRIRNSIRGTFRMFKNKPQSPATDPASCQSGWQSFLADRINRLETSNPASNTTEKPVGS